MLCCSTALKTKEKSVCENSNENENHYQLVDFDITTLMKFDKEEIMN